MSDTKSASFKKSMINLRVVTPEKVACDEKVEFVGVPGKTGRYGILPDHESFITLLKPGELRFGSENNPKIVKIGDARRA